MQLQRDSNLLAVISDDFFVQIFDIETRRLVRELSGFSARVLDVVRQPSFYLPTLTFLLIVRLTDVLPRLPLANSHLPRLYNPDIRHSHW
jgi:U3 small nucleolar RNA-associated protein 21